jgi:glutamyl-tRNA synthetase
MHDNTQVRVRFAPSPTGYLHIGGLRTAFFNWLFARHTKGVFLLRIEDTDLERSTAEYQKSILSSLHWAHLEPDDPMVIQSERFDEHAAVIKKLLDEQKVYRCYCTAKEEVVRYEQETGGDFFVRYDGQCRNYTPTVADEGKPYVVRFKIPTTISHISFNDLIRGPVTFELDQLDDFIIARSDGRPMYNFVVVVDDAWMRITHVVRGEDHISNTPKQILLYHACGYTVPHFAHVPLILGPSGDRLSKRDGATSVEEYRKMGFLPEALLTYLVRLGWSHGDQEIFSTGELIAYFSLEGIGKKGSIFDLEKLRWVNSIYIKSATPTDLYTRVQEDVMPSLAQKLASWSTEKIYHAITLYQDRVHTLAELAHAVVDLHDGPQAYVPLEQMPWSADPAIGQLVNNVRLYLATEQQLHHEQLQEVVTELVKKAGKKIGAVSQPLRMALIGKTSGPGVFMLMSLLGSQECVRRIDALDAYMQKRG